jgi:hypothetical protein
MGDEGHGEQFLQLEHCPDAITVTLTGHPLCSSGDDTLVILHDHTGQEDFEYHLS